jgi:hypothetical protein
MVSDRGARRQSGTRRASDPPSLHPRLEVHMIPTNRESGKARHGLLLWLLGVPIPILLILWLFNVI